MGINTNSLNDGEGRYGSRTRVNRLVYDFEAGDLTSLTTKTAVVNLDNSYIVNLV